MNTGQPPGPGHRGHRGRLPRRADDPSTTVEREKLGPVADKARERVSDVAGQVTEKAKDAAQAAEGAVKEQVSSSG